MPPTCTNCGARLAAEDRFCQICGLDTQGATPPQPVIASPTPPTSTSSGPRPRLWLLAAFAAAMLSAVGGSLAAYLLTRDDRTETYAPSAQAGASYYDEFPTDSPRDDSEPAPERASGEETTPERAASAPATELLSEPGYEIRVPVGAGWSVGDTVVENEGRRFSRTITGPDGAVVRIVHTPGFDAAPDPDTVVARSNFPSSAVSSQRLTLANFPTDECRARLCDDFILNDPVFGGLAILANGSGANEVAVAAEQIASSVAANP